MADNVHVEQKVEKNEINDSTEYSKNKEKLDNQDVPNKRIKLEQNEVDDNNNNNNNNNNSENDIQENSNSTIIGDTPNTSLASVEDNAISEAEEKNLNETNEKVNEINANEKSNEINANKENNTNNNKNENDENIKNNTPKINESDTNDVDNMILYAARKGDLPPNADWNIVKQRIKELFLERLNEMLYGNKCNDKYKYKCKLEFKDILESINTEKINEKQGFSIPVTAGGYRIEKSNSVLKQSTSNPSILIRECLKLFIDALDSFKTSPPYTLQRLSELVLSTEQYGVSYSIQTAFEHETNTANDDFHNDNNHNHNDVYDDEAHDEVHDKAHDKAHDEAHDEVHDKAHDEAHNEAHDEAHDEAHEDLISNANKKLNSNIESELTSNSDTELNSKSTLSSDSTSASTPTSNSTSDSAGSTSTSTSTLVSNSDSTSTSTSNLDSDSGSTSSSPNERSMISLSDLPEKETYTRERQKYLGKYELFYNILIMRKYVRAVLKLLGVNATIEDYKELNKIVITYKDKPRTDLDHIVMTEIDWARPGDSKEEISDDDT